LKKANELLKKELGIDRQLLTNREKTQLVDALRSTHALPIFAKLGLATQFLLLPSSTARARRQVRRGAVRVHG
jgi:hypothetical protein